ncbi:MAG: hypothetical protein KC425_05220, partial [Anaerolineales bacterium]|nr:hypothetical protein [Anaerolineales bacterium]
LHLSYLGQSVLPANKPSQIRASFIVSPGLPGLAAPASDVATLRFGMESIHGGPIAEIMLFDDGSHGDGQAGDGIYGGVITPPAGTWRLVASGTLADGSLFRRVDPIPIRVQRIRFGPAQNLNALAGSTVVQSFALTNEGAAPQSLDLLLSSSMGWALTTTVPSSVTLGAGETAVFHVPVTIPPGAAAGDLEETALTVVDAQDIFLNQTATGITTVVTELTIFLPAIRR